MLTPQIIDAMVDNGCTAQQIAAVVKAALIAQQETNQEKRARDAERQRRCRSKSQPVTDCHVMSRDVTVTECDPSLPPLIGQWKNTVGLLRRLLILRQNLGIIGQQRGAQRGGKLIGN